MRICISAVLVFALGSACMASETFKDVPKDHWAAESVEAIAEAGIMRGYPNDTFGGNKSVTRYELAVTLENFIHFVLETEKPLINSEAELSLTPKTHWGENSMHYLRTSGFVSDDSALLKEGQALITQDDLAQALASVGAKLIAMRIPPPIAEE